MAMYASIIIEEIYCERTFETTYTPSIPPQILKIQFWHLQKQKSVVEIYNTPEFSAYRSEIDILSIICQ